EQAKQQLQQVAGLLGMDVAQALGALGAKWSFYSRVGENGLPAMALTIDVRDKPRLVELEQRLRSMLPASGDIPNVGRMTQTQVGGQTATTIRFQAPQLAQY